VHLAAAWAFDPQSRLPRRVQGSHVCLDARGHSLWADEVSNGSAKAISGQRVLGSRRGDLQQVRPAAMRNCYEPGRPQRDGALLIESASRPFVLEEGVREFEKHQKLRPR
jgi:hypothetical protein